MSEQVSKTDALDDRIVALLRREDALTVPEIAADLRVTPGAARGAVKRLVAAERIKPAGVSSTGARAYLSAGEDAQSTNEPASTITPAVIARVSTTKGPLTVRQPWGVEYACCGGEAGSDQHIGRCGS